MSLEEFGKGHGGAGGTPVTPSDQSVEAAATERLNNTPNVYDRIPRPEPKSALKPIPTGSGHLLHPSTFLILPEDRGSSDWEGVVGHTPREAAAETIEKGPSKPSVDVTRGDEVIMRDNPAEDMTTGPSSTGRATTGRTVSRNSTTSALANAKTAKTILHEGRHHIRLLTDHVNKGLSEYGKSGPEEVVGSLAKAKEHLDDAAAHFGEFTHHRRASRDEQAFQHADAAYGSIKAAHDELTAPHMLSSAATTNLPVSAAEIDLNKAVTKSTLSRFGFKPLGKPSRKVQLGRSGAGLIDTSSPMIALRLAQLNRLSKNKTLTGVQADALAKTKPKRTRRFRKADQAARVEQGLPAAEIWERGAKNNPKTPETVETVRDATATTGIVGVSPQVGVPGRSRPADIEADNAARAEVPAAIRKLSTEEAANAEADDRQRGRVVPESEQRARRVIRAKNADKKMMDDAIKRRESAEKRKATREKNAPQIKERAAAKKQEQLKRDAAAVEAPSTITPPKGTPSKITSKKRAPKGGK